MEKYIVEINPHYYYFGLPGSPECTLIVRRLTYRHQWSIFPSESSQVFDCHDRDLFRVVAQCNAWFRKNSIGEKQVTWPDWCRYIKDYNE